MEKTPIELFDEALKEYREIKKKLIIEAFNKKGIEIDTNLSSDIVYSIIHDGWECYFAGKNDFLVIAIKAWDNTLVDADLENGKCEIKFPPLEPMTEFTDEFINAVMKDLQMIRSGS